MSTPFDRAEEVRELFSKHSPEVSAGVVEIVSVARQVGRRCYIAVRSHATDVDPVKACVRDRSHAKQVVAAMNGEHFAVVRWDSTPRAFITNACAGLGDLRSLNLDDRTRTATLTVTPMPQDVSLGIEQRDLKEDLPLISELTGWTVVLDSSGA